MPSPATDPPPRRSRARRALRSALRVALLLLVAVTAAGVAFALLFDLDQALEVEKTRWLPVAEHRLGRTIEIGAVRTTLWPELGAELRDVVVHGARAGDPPLLRLDRVQVRVALWDALRSAGTDVRVTGLSLDGLRVTLVRRPDGTLAYADVIDRWRRGPPKAGAPKSPMRPEVRRFLENVRLTEVALRDASVELRDEATGGAPVVARIDHIALGLRDVALVSPIDLTVSAAALSAEPNLEIGLRFGPVPIGRKGPMPVERLRLKATDLDLSRLAPYLGEAAPVRIDSARLTADLEVRDPLARAGRTRVQGSLDVTALVVGGGAPFHLHVEPGFDLDLGRSTLELNDVVVAIDDMRIVARGHLSGFMLGWPVFDGLAVRGEGLALDRLLAHLPDLRRWLPAGADLAGPVVIGASGGGTLRAQDVEARIDLGGARVLWPGLIDKPAGVALDVHARAHRESDAVSVQQLRATIGPLALAVSGEIEHFAAPRYRLEGGTGRFAIDALVKILPGVRAAIPPDLAFGGQAELTLHARGAPDALDLRLTARLDEADVRVPEAWALRGGGTLSATAVGDPRGAVRVDGAVDLTALDIDSAVLRKGAAEPLLARAALRVEPGRTTVLDLDVTLGAARFDGAGAIDHGTRHLALAGDLAPFAVGPLAGSLPTLPLAPLRAGTLAGRLVVSGDPLDPASLTWSLRDLDARVGAGRLTGWARVTADVAPTAAFALTATALDLDALRPAAPAPPWVRALHGEGDLTLADARAGGGQVEAWTGTVRLEAGAAHATPSDPTVEAALGGVIFGAN